MKKLALIFCALIAVICVAYAGTEQQYSGKEMKQAVEPAPCPSWYADNEWFASIWGTYAFESDDNSDDEPGNIEDHQAGGLLRDDAWGGGIDVKYFFRKHYGFGVEGFILVPKHDRHEDSDFDDDDADDDTDNNNNDDDDWAGAVKGTFTLRWPINCSRVAPYIWAGAGVAWGGADELEDFRGGQDDDDDDTDSSEQDDHIEDVQPIGQIGGGLEIRITDHIGIVNDFSWNFAKDTSFGMFRSGVSFAF